MSVSTYPAYHELLRIELTSLIFLFPYVVQMSRIKKYAISLVEYTLGTRCVSVYVVAPAQAASARGRVVVIIPQRSLGTIPYLGSLGFPHRLHHPHRLLIEGLPGDQQCRKRLKPFKWMF